MEKVNLNESLSSQYIAEIERGESAFGYVPMDIGDFVFCGSMNYKKEADNPNIRYKQFSVCLCIFVGIPILSWLVLNDSPIWNLILTFVCAIGLYKSYKNIFSFSGKDYFVGKLGFCIVDFERSRNNIVHKELVLFDNVSDLITEQIHTKTNGQYSGTQYYVSFVSDKKSKVEFWERGSYDKELPDLKRTFYNKVMDSWKNFKMKDLGKIPITFNAFNIKDGAIQDAFMPYIEVFDDVIRIHGKDYFYNDVKQMKFEAVGGGICLLVEHKNHKVEKKLFGRKKETGDVERIPLAAIGNQDFFILYFQWLISTKGLLSSNEEH